jgi:hypothetical protein
MLIKDHKVSNSTMAIAGHEVYDTQAGQEVMLTKIEEHYIVFIMRSVLRH